MKDVFQLLWESLNRIFLPVTTIWWSKYSNDIPVIRQMAVGQGMRRKDRLRIMSCHNQSINFQHLLHYSHLFWNYFQTFFKQENLCVPCACLSPHCLLKTGIFPAFGFGYHILFILPNFMLFYFISLSCAPP